MQVFEIKINPEYEKLVPPLSELDYQKLYESIKTKGLIDRIKINKKGEILDGHHRYKICKDLGLEMKTEEYEFNDTLEEMKQVMDWNLERRHLNIAQRIKLGYDGYRSYYQKLAEERLRLSNGRGQKRSGGIPPEVKEHRSRDDIAKQVGVKDSKTYWYGEQILKKRYSDEGIDEEGGDTVGKLLVEKLIIPENSTQEEIDGIVTELYNTIYNYETKREELIEQWLNGDKGTETCYREIQGWDKQIFVEIEKLQPKSDKEIMETLEVDILPYDAWPNLRIDNRFGNDYPGRIPAHIIFNTLYFFTKQGDLVVDPMAGGGVVGDVCKSMRREYFLYDAVPENNTLRDDVKKWDLYKGIPEEAKNAKLLFIDPPYYKKLEEDYGTDSVSSLPKGEFLKMFEDFARNSYNTNIQYLAFLMSDYINEENIDENIFIWDYVNLFTKAGWKVVRNIQCPLIAHKISPMTIINNVKNRKLGYLTRSLVIFKR